MVQVRVTSQTIRKKELEKMKSKKNIRKMKLEKEKQFQKIIVSPSWAYEPGLNVLQPHGRPLVPASNRAKTKCFFSPAWLVPVGQPGVKPLTSQG
jgi:hypothetical protein